MRYRGTTRRGIQTDLLGDAGAEARGLAQGLLSDTATRILYNQPPDEATAADKVLGLTTTQTGQLPDLSQGEGFWKVNRRAFVVRHICHICTPDELALFDTSARMLGHAGSSPQPIRS